MENIDKQSTVVKQSATISCCHCGTQFSVSTTGTNICLDCLSKTVDITAGVSREGVLERCESCKRFLRAPSWVYAEHESKDLLALCLKKVKGLNKVNLIDAKFIWTDPTSKHVKIKLTVQQEVMNNASIQQTFPVEFVITELQCDECRIEDTHHTWRASVQVRQHADYKKTFLYLEQLIIKQNLHPIMHSIEEAPGGINFNFKDRAGALKLNEFLEGLVPTKIKASSKHISTNEQSMTHAYKFIYSVEIPKVCQDDLIALTPKLRGVFGGCSKVLLCTKVASVIHFIDLKSMKNIEMSGVQYFQYENEFEVLPAYGNLTEFMVFDVEPLESKNQNVKTSRITIGRTSDWTNFEVKTHLGDSLKEGTTVLGYDLSNMNLTGLLEEVVQSGEIPDVIIVNKVYSENEKKKLWDIIKADFQKDGEKEYDDFLSELEFDPVLRAHLISLDNEEGDTAKKTTPHEIKQNQAEAPKKTNKKKAEAAKKKQDDLIDEKELHTQKGKEETKPDVEKKGVKKLTNVFNLLNNEEEDDEIEDDKE